MTKTELRQLLQDNIVEVTFTKKNGDVRAMICTLNPEMDEGLAAYDYKGSDKPEVDNIIRVWDIANNGWRSINLETLIEYTIAD